MSRIVEVVRNASKNPVEAIQVVVALVAFCIAAYVISPFFVIEASPVVDQAFNSLVIGKVLFFFLIMLPSVPIILGLFYRRFQTVDWYTRSTFFMSVGFLFIVLLRLVTVGFLPLVWVPSLALSIIMAICWAYWKAR